MTAPSRIALTCKASVCFLVIILGKCNLVSARCSRGAADTRLHFYPVVKGRKRFLTSPFVTEHFEAFTKAEFVWCKTTSDLLFAMAANCEAFEFHRVLGFCVIWGRVLGLCVIWGDPPWLTMHSLNALEGSAG